MLLDMKEGGTFTLNGYDGAAVTSLSVAVENFAGVAAFIRNSYAGRLFDVLDVRV